MDTKIPLGTISTSTKENLGWKMRVRVIRSACPECGREKWVPLKYNGTLCSPCSLRLKAQPKGWAVKNKDGDKQRGALNHMWKGGIKTDAKGYVLEKVPRNDPMYSVAHAQDYALQHRLVVSRAIGRPLLPTETVHHRNGQRGDNRIENLELWFHRHPSGQRQSENLCPSCPFRSGVCDELASLADGTPDGAA